MMKQCKNGHIYDDAKSQFCPYCGATSAVGEESCGARKDAEEFRPHENFTPCVYGSPEWMMGVRNKKKWLYALLIALGVSAFIIFIILIYNK
ncbi:MAG: hypothetical protein E7415_01490 [Ruminococcaceae bacterium]|nr:hypothetical protein [Oscillospiraceae bacterium]